jgi:hypothetical protein
VLIVVDYVEDTRADTVVALLKALRGREGIARVVLTARAVGDWLTTITASAQRDAVPIQVRAPIALPRRHPKSGALFRRAAARFAELPKMTVTDADPPEGGANWTTLDVILQAWLAATGHKADQLPPTRCGLYNEILGREFYWQRTIVGRGCPSTPVPCSPRSAPS